MIYKTRKTSRRLKIAIWRPAGVKISQSDKKMVNRVIPIFVSYCISRFVDIADLDDAAIKISRFNDYSNDNVMKYFKELFGLMVQKTTYQEKIEY